jgi:predicted nucleic-acid-binding protein
MIFVDTNIFTRLLVKDDTGQHEKAKSLFMLAQEGKAELVTGHPVFFELAWVLSYTYKVSNSEILDRLESILSFGGLKVSDRGFIAEAISLARATNGSFADSYIVASLQRLQAKEVATFDKKFSNLGAKLYPLGERN